MTQYVLGFMVSDDNCVALVKKSKPDWQRGKWNGVGGHVERNELSINAMVREFREETGVETKYTDWNYKFTMSGPGWRSFVYVTRTKDKPFLVGLPDEPVSWWPLSKLPEVIPNLRWLIPMSLDPTLDYSAITFKGRV